MESKIIGSKIAKARKKMNISQAQLAEQLSISPQAVGKWERGESVPDIIMINRITKLLGVDLNYFSNETISTASKTTTGEISDNHQTTEVDSNSGRQLLTNFSGSNLPETDFAGVTAHNRKFNGSSLSGSDFSGADLTGSMFTGSDVHDANFNKTNLTDCTLSANDLADASFNKTILVHTVFNASALTGAKFAEIELYDVKLTNTDLRKTIFENCVFKGVDFKHSDMRGLCLDSQTFIDVTFDNTALNGASFKGATLKNVSFRATFALTNKYYRALKTISFDNAKMDKLTFAALKGVGVDLSKVTVI